MLRWIMAEVPSVVYWLPEYAKLGIDGVSIGSNDLTQLMLGVDRDSEVCKDLFDTLDPAVLDAIDHIIERASAAGLTTSSCGQAVSTSTDLAEQMFSERSATFRRGTIDSWRQDLPEALAERIVVECHEVMARLGLPV